MRMNKRMGMRIIRVIQRMGITLPWHLNLNKTH